MVGQPTIFAAQPTPARLSCHPNRFSFEEIPVKRKRILEQRTRYRPLRSNDRESLVTERRKNKYKKSKLSICMSSCQAGIVMPSWTISSYNERSFTVKYFPPQRSVERSAGVGRFGKI